MRHKTPTRTEGILAARRIKKTLLERGVPVVDVLLFGSIVRDGKKPNDIDIAIIYDQFESSRLEECATITEAREDYSVPMDIVCLRQEDMENIFSTIVQEVKKTGQPV